MALAGDDFQHATLQHPQLQEWVASAMAITKAKIYADLEYDDSRDRWSQMVLLGGTGVGKTTLGTAVFRHHADRVLAPGATDSDETYVRSMLWISAVQLGTARRETRLGHAVTLIDRALSAAVLMLDDLGQETADSRDDIKFVLIERQRHRRRTIVTTGFQLEQLGKEYGEHIQRRLVERSHVLQIQAKKNSSLKGSGTTP